MKIQSQTVQVAVNDAGFPGGAEGPLENGGCKCEARQFGTVASLLIHTLDRRPSEGQFSQTRMAERRGAAQRGTTAPTQAGKEVGAADG